MAWRGFTEKKKRNRMSSQSHKKPLKVTDNEHRMREVKDKNITEKLERQENRQSSYTEQLSLSCSFSAVKTHISFARRKESEDD
jgi:hypothetical protein